MKITFNLFESYLICPTKCWLNSQDEVGLGNPYADWIRAQNESYRCAGVRKIQDNYDRNECYIASPEPVNLLSTKWRIAVHLLIHTQFLESYLHAVERAPSEDIGKLDQFIPIYFVFTNNMLSIVGG